MREAGNMITKDDAFVYWTPCEPEPMIVAEMDEKTGSEDPDYSGMLAVLLMNEVVFVNDHWWKKEWNEEAKKEATSINCLCNDLFCPAADAETVPFRRIPELFNHWIADEGRGHLVWCAKHRNATPWRPHLEEWLNASPAWSVEYTPRTEK